MYLYFLKAEVCQATPPANLAQYHTAHSQLFQFYPTLVI